MDKLRIIPNKQFDYVNTTDPAITTNPEHTGASWLNMTTGELFFCLDNTVDDNAWRGALGTQVGITGIVDAAEFTAANSAYLAATSALFNSLSTFSVEFYINFVSGSYIMTDATNGLGWEAFLVNRTNIVINTSNASGTRIFTTMTDLQGAGWVHVAVTYDGTTIKIYQDGILDNSQVAAGKTLWNNPNQFCFGCYTPLGSASYSTMGLSQFRVWNDARTQEEIQANMGRAVLLDRTDLRCEMMFDNFLTSGTCEDTQGVYTGNYRGPVAQSQVSIL